MYSQFNPLPHVLPFAESFVIENDRKHYFPYYKEAEEFMAEQQLIFGGEISMDLLLRSRPTLQEDKYRLRIGPKHPYIIYSTDPFIHANKLADRFLGITHTFFNTSFIAVETVIDHQELFVVVNNRRIIRFLRIPSYKHKSLLPYIHTKKVKGLFSDAILNILYESHLPALYHKLYEIHAVSEWPTILRYESELFDMVSGNLDGLFQITAQKTGSGEEQASSSDLKLINTNLNIDWYNHDEDEDEDEDDDSRIIIDEFNDIIDGGLAQPRRSMNKKMRARIHSTLIDHFVTNKDDFIMLNFGNDIFSDKQGRMQVITSPTLSLEAIREIVRRADITEDDSKLLESIVISTFQINLLDDFYLSKEIVLCEMDGHKTVLFELFNSLQYEIIPWMFSSKVSEEYCKVLNVPWCDVKSSKTRSCTSYRVVNHFVALRFKFIELWNLKIIAAGMDNPIYLNQRITQIGKDVQIIRKDLFHTNPKTVFSPKSYMGTYLPSADLHAKFRGQSKRNKYYYPANKKNETALLQTKETNTENKKE